MNIVLFDRDKFSEQIGTFTLSIALRLFMKMSHENISETEYYPMDTSILAQILTLGTVVPTVVSGVQSHRLSFHF